MITVLFYDDYFLMIIISTIIVIVYSMIFVINYLIMFVSYIIFTYTMIYCHIISSDTMCYTVCRIY